MPHPAVQIYIWASLALILQVLNGPVLVIVAGIFILLSFWVCAARFLLLLRRTRWILLSIFMIYAYWGAGASLWPQLGAFSPVLEGVQEGFAQILRLLIILSSLSVLLALLPQSQLISGLNTLVYPLSFFGVARERIIVRLALTMHYAESAMLDASGSWRSRLEKQLQVMPVKPGLIEVKSAPLNLRDWIMLVVVSVAAIGIFL